MNKSVVFITGGSRGIGKAIIDEFKLNHWITVSCSRTDVSAKNIDADFYFACDVTDPKQVKQATHSIIKKYGRLDVVINNAGIAGENSLNENDSDDFWHDIINTNLHGTYYVCKYALNHLPNHTGRIINIASVLGLKGVPDQTAYCAAKHGVVGFTKALAYHTASRGITVNAICPGWTRTDMMRNRVHELGLEEKDLIHSIPMNKIVEPDEIAKLVYFLACSSGASNITGQAIPIDGGAIA